MLCVCVHARACMCLLHCTALSNLFFTYRRKLAARATDTEEKYEALEAQKKNLEKTKNRLAGEVEDLMLDLEKAQTNAGALDKKQKKFDQQINEWKLRYEGATEDLENAQKEARGYSTEVRQTVEC